MNTMAAVPATDLHARKPGRTSIALAIAASIAIHALILLVLFPGLREVLKPGRTDPGPIVARLVETRPLAAASAVSDENPPPMPERLPTPPPALQPVPPPPSRPLAQPRAAVAPAAPPRVLPAEVVGAAEPAQNSPSEARPAEARPALVVRSEPVAPAPAPLVATPTADAADPATLGQYRIALITAAMRYKQYPRVAIDNSWEGRAEVRLVIDANGAIASLSIKTPSGYEVLDRQALDMIRKAKPLATIPAALRGKGFTLDLPVLFSLKEETG